MVPLFQCRYCSIESFRLTFQLDNDFLDIHFRSYSFLQSLYFTDWVPEKKHVFY